MSYSKQNFRSGDTLYASQLNAMDDEIAVLEAEVESTKNMVGSPLTASTAAGMSDQTKIYVYTGNETGYTAGHWYYYNGTAWTDGGVYNSVAVNTDTSLTVSGQAADSKAVGDAIDEIDGDLSDVKSDLSDLSGTVDGKYSKPSTGIPASDLASGVIPNVTVTDVQVNGTTVLNQGVAEIPLASNTNAGVVKVLSANGIRINSSGQLEINYPADSQIKNGSAYFRPIVPALQEKSTFYGLAKAAGDATQSSSSNAVGTYTDDAKIKIQKMLGIYEAPWELIREDTFTNAEEANHSITVDGNGEPFELTDMLLIMSVPKHAEDTIVGDYGRVYVYNGTSTIKTLYALNVTSRTITAESSEYTGIVQVTQEGSLTRSEIYQWSARAARANRQIVVMENEGGSSKTASFSFFDSPPTITSIVIGGITGLMHYRLFGKRKWS